MSHKLLVIFYTINNDWMFQQKLWAKDGGPWSSDIERGG